MSLRRRTYPEVVDNVLTALTQGVAAESHPFPPPTGGPPFTHPLERPPVASVVSVYGSRGGAPHRFRDGADYALADDATLAWQDGADLPDAGTLIQVNYLPADAEPVLTDIQTGSVVRTLSEAMAKEMARLYAQLEAVYKAGFIDSAEGRSLDNLVALLGIERVAGGHAAGDIEFRRAGGSRGTVFVPVGTRVSTVDGEIAYATTAGVSLAEGQQTVRTSARDLEPGNDILPADALVVLPTPIAGIAAVSNPAPTAITTQDESDEQLRARAKSFLAGSEKATRGSLEHALARLGVQAEIDEQTSDGVKNGRVVVTPQAEQLAPELEQRLLTSVAACRPLGVEVTLAGVAQPRRVDLEMRLTTTSGLLEEDLRGIQDAVEAAVAGYFAALPSQQAGSVSKLVGLAFGVDGVEDVRVVRATLDDGTDVLDREAGTLALDGLVTTLGTLRLADPALPTRLDVVVGFAAGDPPPDSAAIPSALGETISYLNEINASEPAAGEAPDDRRSASFARLLHSLPLPVRPGQTLRAHDDAVAAGNDPGLPTAADVAPYAPRFVLTAASGDATVLAADDDRYDLTPFERLTLAGIEIEIEEA